MAPGPLVAIVVAALASAAWGHPLAPSLLELREEGGGRVAVGWKTPLVRPRGAGALEPVLPGSCRPTAAPTTAEEGGGVWRRWTVACDPAGLVGTQVGVGGFGAAVTGALVRVILADGRTVESVVTPSRPMLTVPAEPHVGDVLRDYGRLGVEHILTGPDHLLFVFGLLLLAGRTRRLLAMVTAFTVGHSVTLTLAALGWIVIPQAPIESAIAASVLALAVELARRPPHPTLMRRWPWAMAGTFGLLHGLGFAAALRDAGLPAGAIPFALFSFNVGIEVGQLAFVLATLAAWRVAAAVPARPPAWAWRVPVYAMGSLAAFWWLERTLAIFE